MLRTAHFDVIEHRAPCQYMRQYPRATSQLDEDELYLAVKQYVPRAKPLGNGERSTGITIVACHANGAPKELYEPLWDALYEYMRKESGTHILSIWIADVFNQGQSGILNEEKLGNDPSWFDHSRDYLTMITHFRKEMKQPIVGFGHSMGGTILTNVALMHPRLFATLITFEPMFFKSPKNSTSLGAYGITFRKDRWPSHEAAAQVLSKHPLYKHWDRDVLNIFLEYGLRKLPTVVHPDRLPSDGPAPVTLATTKHQEASNYVRGAFPPSRSIPFSEYDPSTEHHDIGDANWRHPDEPFYRAEMAMTFHQLPHLRPSCLILYGAKTNLVLEQQLRDERVDAMGVGLGGSGGAAKGRVKELKVQGGGHFLPFESPKILAHDVVGPWFVDEVKRWKEEAEAERKAWEAVSPAQRSQLSEDWRHFMKTYNDPRKVDRSARVKL